MKMFSASSFLETSPNPIGASSEKNKILASTIKIAEWIKPTQVIWDLKTQVFWDKFISYPCLPSHPRDLYFSSKPEIKNFPKKRFLSWLVHLCHRQILQRHLETEQATNWTTNSGFGQESHPGYKIPRYSCREIGYTCSKRGWELAVPSDRLIQSNKKGRNWLFWFAQNLYCLYRLIPFQWAGWTPPHLTNNLTFLLPSPPPYLCSQHYLPFQFCQHRTVGCDAFSAQQCRLFLVYNLLPN